MYGVATQNGVGLGVGNIPTLTSLAYPQMLNAIVLGAFSGGAPGWLYDDTNQSTLFQDAAGTTPVTALEQPVGLQLDLSGRGNHRYQPTSANRPTWSARVNGALKSEALNGTGWTQNGVTTTVATGLTLPSKYAAASLITSNAGAGAHYVVRSGSFTYPAGTQLKYTAWVQKGTTQYAFLGDQSDASYHNATFDLTAGTVSGQTNAVGAITPNGDGFDISTTFTLTNATTGGPQFGPSVIPNVAVVPNYTAAGTETVYMTGIDIRPSDQSTGLIPTYQRVNTATDYDSVGFPAGLRWNGSNSWMQNASVDFSGTNKVSLFVGVRKQSDAAVGIVTELSVNAASNNGAFYLGAPASAGSAYFQGYGGGTSKSSTLLTGLAAPITETLSHSFDISAPNQTLRGNGGASTNTSTATQGTGNFGNYPSYFGARAGTSLFFNGLTFSNIAIGIELSASQIAAFEAWTNSRTKAYA